jgi:hypothetical protein
MSSSDVRTAINAAVTAAAAPTPVFDLSDYVSLEDCLGDIDSEALLIQYVATGERVASIGVEGNQGWEEDGSVVLHLVVPTGFNSAPVASKGDAIRYQLRGMRLDPKIVIEACDPFTDFGGGSTGLYGGAWHGWASNLYYVRRDCG